MNTDSLVTSGNNGGAADNGNAGTGAGNGTDTGAADGNGQAGAGNGTDTGAGAADDVTASNEPATDNTVRLDIE